MQKPFSEIYQDPTNVSFEFFPPKTNRGLKQIFQSINHLKNLKPDFISVTYGAGGTTNDKSLEISSAIANLAEINCVSHLTCVGMNRDQIGTLLDDLRYQGIKNVLALRGDAPKDADGFQKTENGFSYASELVGFIKERTDFGILVAGYPEGHQENPSKEDDLKRLIDKIQAGADAVVTQLFLDNQCMFDFAEKLQAAGVKIPLIAGIFPISNGKQIARIIELSGAKVPAKLRKGIDTYLDQPDEMLKFGTDYAIEQVARLHEGGVKSFHFYTMNRFSQVETILQNLKGLFPKLHLD